MKELRQPEWRRWRWRGELEFQETQIAPNKPGLGLHIKIMTDSNIVVDLKTLCG